MRLYFSVESTSGTVRTLTGAFRGPWSSSGGFFSNKMDKFKLSPANGNVDSVGGGINETSATNPYKYPYFKFVSEELAENTIVHQSTTTNIICKMKQYTSDANAYLSCYIWLMNPDGTLNRVIRDISNSTSYPPAGTVGVAAAGVTIGSAVIESGSTDQVWPAGTRIVVELGASFYNSTTASKGAFFAVGGVSETDLSVGSTDIDAPGFLEISQNIKFAAEGNFASMF